MSHYTRTLYGEDVLDEWPYGQTEDTPLTEQQETIMGIIEKRFTDEKPITKYDLLDFALYVLDQHDVEIEE